MREMEADGTSVDSKIKRDWKKISKRNMPPVFGEGTSQTHTIKTLKTTGNCIGQFVLQSVGVKITVQM
jgi:hypothetical protein